MKRAERKLSDAIDWKKVPSNIRWMYHRGLLYLIEVVKNCPGCVSLPAIDEYEAAVAEEEM